MHISPHNFVVWMYLMPSFSMSFMALTAAFLLAAEEGMSGNTTVIGALVGGFSLMTGIMAWVLRHLLDKTIPEINKTFQEAMEKRNLQFSETINSFQLSLVKAQENFSQDLRYQAKLYVDSETNMRDYFRTRVDEGRKFFEDEVKMLMEDFKRDRDNTVAELKIVHEKFFDLLIEHQGEDKRQNKLP